MSDAGEDTAGVQQVRYGAKRCRRGCFTRCGGVQVGPGGRDERARTVGQDQDQIQLAVAPHPAEQRERLACQRVAGSDHRDLGWIALEVGSVAPFRSTGSITRPYSRSSGPLPPFAGLSVDGSVQE